MVFGMIFRRWAYRGDVFTVWLMPAREDIVFFSGAVTAMTFFKVGQWLSLNHCLAKLSDPSSFSPRGHSTNPPRTERVADPDRWRAMMESSRASRSNPIASHAATARAAMPDAEEAKPAAVGKWLTDATRALCLDLAFARTRSRRW